MYTYVARVHNIWLINLCNFLQALQSLADYDEDSDEENTAEEVTSSPAKRPKIDST